MVDLNQYSICPPDEFCEEFPHNLIPTPGYWIECSRQKIASDTIWDESESEREEERLEDEDGDDSRPHRDQLLEDDEDEDDEEIPRCVVDYTYLYRVSHIPPPQRTNPFTQ